MLLDCLHALLPERPREDPVRTPLSDREERSTRTGNNGWFAAEST